MYFGRFVAYFYACISFSRLRCHFDRRFVSSACLCYLPFREYSFVNHKSCACTFNQQTRAVTRAKWILFSRLFSSFSNSLRRCFPLNREEDRDYNVHRVVWQSPVGLLPSLQGRRRRAQNAQRMQASSWLGKLLSCFWRGSVLYAKPCWPESWSSHPLVTSVQLMNQSNHNINDLVLKMNNLMLHFLGCATRDLGSFQNTLDHTTSINSTNITGKGILFSMVPFNFLHTVPVPCELLTKESNL